MVVLLIVIFIGFLNHFRAMYFDGQARAPTQVACAVSRWCVAPMWLALAPLLVFGLWWPSELWNHFMAGGAESGGGCAMTASPQHHAAPGRDQRRRYQICSTSGGRMQMAYAWYRAPRRARTALCREPGRQGAVRDLALRRGRRRSEPRQYLAPAGLVRARDHRPVRAALCRSSAAAAAGAARGRQTALARRSIRTIPPTCRCVSSPTMQAIPELARRRRPTCNCCRSARCAPTCSNPPSSCSSTSARRSCTTIRGCSSSIAAWRSASRGCRPRAAWCWPSASPASAAWRMRSPIARRWRRRPIAAVPPRARFLRVLLAEMERLYNHLHYFGHLCHTTTLKVGEAEGKLLEERAKQLNARLTGSRFLRSLLVPRRPAARSCRPKPWLAAELDALARRVRRLRAAYGEHRQPSRPADHHRQARSSRRLRPGRDRARRARLGPRPRFAARPPLRRLCRAASAQSRCARTAMRMRARRCAWRRSRPASR